jgi:hypothetical protein
MRRACASALTFIIYLTVGLTLVLTSMLGALVHAETAPPNAVVIDYPPPRTKRPPGPNPRQALAHSIECDELLYGGAAGGGKTDWLIAEVIAVLMEFPGSNGAIFRRTFPQLSELGGIEQRLLNLIPRWAGVYNASDHIWTFANGSKLRLCFCDTDKDVTKYQGAEWAILAFDQVEQFTEFQYRYLQHRLRVSGVSANLMEAAGYRPKVICTANPGGVGHGWVKRRWVDPFPTGFTVFRPAPSIDDEDPGTKCYVPATVDDNPEVNEDYVRQLDRLPPAERQAMRHGDWNVHSGQRFPHFRTATHVIEPEDLPIPVGAGITRGVGVDYGLDAPFCALWGALLPDNLVVVYRELYTPGLVAWQQAQAMLGAEARGERRAGRPSPVALDPACWARNPTIEVPKDYDAANRGPADEGLPPPGSIAAEYLAQGVPVQKANNDRLAGVAIVSDRLIVRPDGLPRLLIYSTCPNLIRTLPELIRDPKRPEDIDTNGEDHGYDALRYLLFLLLGMSPGGPNPGDGHPVTLGPDSMSGERITSDTGSLLRAEL